MPRQDAQVVGTVRPTRQSETHAALAVLSSHFWAHLLLGSVRTALGSSHTWRDRLECHNGIRALNPPLTLVWLLGPNSIVAL